MLYVLLFMLAITPQPVKLIASAQERREPGSAGVRA